MTSRTSITNSIEIVGLVGKDHVKHFGKHLNGGRLAFFADASVRAGREPRRDVV